MSSISGGTATARIELVVDPWSEVERQLEADAKRYPKFADVRHNLGATYLQEGRYDDALSEFDAALEINSKYLLARFHRLVALRMKNGSLDPQDWDGANLESEGSPSQVAIWSAWYSAQSGNYSGAEDALRALGSDPKWGALAHFSRWVYSHGSGKPNQEALEEAARANPLYKKILDSRSCLGAATAEAAAVELLGEDFDPTNWIPGNGAVHEALGTHCARQGALDQAVRYYEDAFLREGEESRQQVRMARLSLAQGEEESAVSCLQRAIELDPTSVEARTALGFEYQSQGYHDEALIQFEVAARLRPGYPDIQYNLGLLYEAQDRDDDARRCYDQALSINPKYFQARTSLAQLQLRSSQFEDAIETLSPLEGSRLRSADLMVQKAEAHMALEQFALAINELEQAVDLNPSYPRTYYILGQAYRKQGLKRKAQEAWKQHLEKTRRWTDDQQYLDEEDWRP